MIFTANPTPECLYAKVEGPFTLAEGTRTLLELVDAIYRHKPSKVLFDGRGISGNLTTMQRFEYASFGAKALRQLELSGMAIPQLAWVLTQPVSDPARFGETVAVNRGIPVKVFEDIASARRWLGLADDSPQRNG